MQVLLLLLVLSHLPLLVLSLRVHEFLAVAVFVVPLAIYHLSRASFELFLALYLAQTFLGCFDFMLEALPHVLYVVISFLCNLCQLKPLLLLELLQLFLKCALVLNFLLFELGGNLLKAQLYRLVDDGYLPIESK